MVYAQEDASFCFYETGVTSRRKLFQNIRPLGDRRNKLF